MYTDLDQVIRGDTFTVLFEVTDDITNVGLDLSGRTMTITVKSDISEIDAESIIQEIYVIPSTPETIAGTVSATIPAAKMSLLSPSTRYWYDVQVATGDQVATYLIGRMRVIADVTRTP